MLIQGTLGSGKTSFLIDKYLELISGGAKSSEVLVLCQNSFLKNQFVERVKSKINKGIGSVNAYTFSGIAYRSILNNWPLFENIIPDNIGESVVSPYMVGVDITSYVMKKNLHKGDLDDYQSGMNLMHQLLKRYTITSHNALERNAVLEKSEILNETFAADSQKVLDGLKVDMLKYRFFDYLRQSDAFSKLYFEGVLSDFDDVKYLLVDDFDEFTYQGFRFIADMVKKTESYVAYDKLGGARRGYLCAYPDGYKQIDDEIFELASQNYKLLANFKGEKNKLQNFEIDSTSQNLDMIKSIINTIEKLLSSDVALSDIKIVSPEDNEILNNMLKDYFNKNDISYQFLSGTQRSYDDKLVFCAVVILCLIHPEWHIRISESEIRKLLSEFLEIPFVSCDKVFAQYKKTMQLPLLVDFEGDDAYKYNSLISVVENLKNMECALSDELLYIFKNLILPNSTPEDSFEFFNKLLSSLDDFENLYQKIGEEIPYQEWVLQERSSIVSDNPSSIVEINPNAVIIATPQKLLDYELKSKYQLWIDAKSRAWIKEDTGVLYNAWVLNQNFDKDEYTPELHKKLTLEKTGHLLQKLSLLADKVKIFASDENIMGGANEGELLNYILPAENSNQIKFKIVPREDQAPVLEYKNGAMAVPAVPGAGKTTIMQALIMKLIDDGVKPSEILVLTYMESAARNFLDRIKKSCPMLNEYPHISTIHGLAYKVIADEDNACRIGLNSDFEVCDEAKHSMIINRICLDNLPAGEDFSEWVDYNKSNISRAKMLLLTPDDIATQIEAKPDGQMLDFLKVYKAYTKALRQANLVDYDDLLIFAHKLLDENKDIRAFYQNKFKFVIEDEAQDSSSIQQKLIGLISQGTGNLVRCGDLNQAIMTTFTNADVEGFRQFISNSSKVEMQSSQRCCKDVYELANALVAWAENDADLKDAFYSIQMKPVDGGNPQSENAIRFNSFEYEREEQEFVLKEIKALMAENPKVSIGILLRNNYQSKNWIDFLEQNGVEVLCRADELRDKKVYKLILSLLKFLDNPFDNKLLANLAQEFNYSNLSRLTNASIESVRKLKEPLVKNEEFLSEIKELDNSEMLRFWWDIFYWLDKSNKTIESFLYEFGKYYFSSSTDMGNVNLIASIVKRFKHMYIRENEKEPLLKEVISYMEQLGKSRNAKYFTDENEGMLPVEIMTLHKAKGDEFSAVFIPHMVNRFHKIDPSKISPRKDDMLSLKLDNMAGKKKKDKEKLAVEIASESLRLLYVAITRAEKKLYFSKVEGKDGTDAYDLLQELGGKK